jgi:hypothetical protein
MRPDDYTAHLVLIGGVDWNEATRDMFRRVRIPVSQTTREHADDYGEFTVQENGKKRSFPPTLVKDGQHRVLVEDVAHFYHGRNPYNRKRTVTFLNGMFSRGTLGVVRALTDARFRDRNEAYLRERFGRSDHFSVLTRVPIVNGRVVTPDWTIPDNRLHRRPHSTTTVRIWNCCDQPHMSHPAWLPWTRSSCRSRTPSTACVPPSHSRSN